MTGSLVIVESPAKARTIERYLGPGYRVESSIGHIRDLPRTAAEIPKKYRGRPWARLGVDVDGGFDPLYVIPSEKKGQIAKLRKALRDADELVLATDEDREGEAIAWHLKEGAPAQGPGAPDGPSTRSPGRRSRRRSTGRARSTAVWWTPRRPGGCWTGSTATRCPRCSGRRCSRACPPGRVQSVATRIVVERERERMAFVPAGYWSVQAELETEDGEARRFPARVSAVGGRTVARGRDFERTTGKLRTKARLLTQAEAETLGEELPATRPEVAEVKEKPFTPAAPTRRSSRRPSSRRRRASCASPPSGR